MREWKAAQAQEQDAADGDHVGGEEGEEGQGDYYVEGERGAEVYETLGCVSRVLLLGVEVLLGVVSGGWNLS